MAIAACPFCFHMIDTRRLAYQCAGRGSTVCRKQEDEARVRLTGSSLETYPTFLQGNGRADTATCPTCGGPSKRRACPTCHTALPIDFVGSASPLIGLLGAKGSGKTVLMTVLARHLREAVARRFGADVRIATDNPDGHQGLHDYRSNREDPLYIDHRLPLPTNVLAYRRYATPVVLRWRQESSRRFGSPALRSTTFSFVDTAGEDLADQDSASSLSYASACNGLIITLDPFTIPGARAYLDLPDEAVETDDDNPLETLSRITELLRTEHGIKNTRRITVPIAIVLTKMDAFYRLLDRQSPIMREPPTAQAYDDDDGLEVHEQVMGILRDWKATSIDDHLRLNYANYRYFGISALGREPDYLTSTLAPGGVQPHRVEDPVLWLMSESGVLPRAPKRVRGNRK
jgi:GTPase SAR1 family protein